MEFLTVSKHAQNVFAEYVFRLDVSSRIPVPAFSWNDVSLKFSSVFWNIFSYFLIFLLNSFQISIHFPSPSIASNQSFFNQKQLRYKFRSETVRFGVHNLDLVSWIKLQNRIDGFDDGSHHSIDSQMKFVMLFFFPAHIPQHRFLLLRAAPEDKSVGTKGASANIDKWHCFVMLKHPRIK